MALKQTFGKLPLFVKFTAFFMAVLLCQFVLLIYLWSSHGAGFAQMFSIVLAPLFLIGDFGLFIFLNVVCFLRGLFTRAWGSALLSALILGAIFVGFSEAKRLVTTQFQTLTQAPPLQNPEPRLPSGFMIPPPGWPSASYSLSTSDYSSHGYSMIYHKQGGDTVVTLREDEKDILNRCQEPFKFGYGDVLEAKAFAIEGAGKGELFTVKAAKPQYEVVLRDGARCLSLSISGADKREFNPQNIIEDLQSFPRSP